MGKNNNCNDEKASYVNILFNYMYSEMKRLRAQKEMEILCPEDKISQRRETSASLRFAPRSYRGFAYTSASSKDIVGLIWRSGINQRANILRAPVMQPARRRSFYRRRKTIRIYIRAREERTCRSR